MFFWMSVNFFLPILPLYYHSLGMDDHQIGLAVGAFSLGAVLFRVFSGKAVDRYGSKPVISVGIAVSVVAIAGYYFSTSLLSSTLTRFLHGVGISGYSAAALTTVTLMNDESHTTQAVAVYTLFTMIGMGFSASTANWLFGIGNITLISAVGAAATILSALLFPKAPKLIVKASPGETLPFGRVVANPGVVIPTISLLAVNICYGSVMTFLPLLMLSQGVVAISAFYIAYAVAVVLSRLWVGKLCVWLTPERLAFYILLMLAAIMLVTGQYASQLMLVLCGAGVGIGYGLAFPALATTVTTYTVPANRGTAFGFYTMAVDMGFAIGAIAMGLVAAAWGYQAVFFAAGAYTLIYAAVYRLLLFKRLTVRAQTP
jgi:MFS family permease